MADVLMYSLLHYIDQGCSRAHLAEQTEAEVLLQGAGVWVGLTNAATVASRQRTNPARVDLVGDIVSSSSIDDQSFPRNSPGSRYLGKSQGSIRLNHRRQPNDWNQY